MTDEELRAAIATAIVQSGYDDTDESDDAVMLFEWHHCFDQPNCGAGQTPPSPCPCSGVPYLSERVWAHVGPVVRAAMTEVTR